jgi:hypothetical protein
MGGGLSVRQPQQNGQHRLLSDEAQSAAEAFINEHHDTKKALQASNEANEALRMQVQDLFRENEHLRERLAAAETKMAFFSAYAVEMTTCVDNLKLTTNAIIDHAIERGRANGIRASEAQRLGEEALEDTGEDDQAEVERIVSSLPRTDWSSS